MCGRVVCYCGWPVMVEQSTTCDHCDKPAAACHDEPGHCCLACETLGSTVTHRGHVEVAQWVK